VSQVSPAIRILIADDHALMRAGIRTILATNCRWQVCGEAEDGRNAVDKVQELKPDLVILDISMPRLNGILAAREIRSLAPPTKIIILTMHESPQLELTARQVGADAVITKRMAADSLVGAIESLFDGRYSGPDSVVQGLEIDRSPRTK